MSTDVTAKKVVLDVDTGIDDALAILYACHSPELEIIGIGTVVGNIDAKGAAENTLRVLESAGRSVPVAVGAEQFLVAPVQWSTHIHGQDGMGDTGLPSPRGKPSQEHAVDQLIRLVGEHPGQVTVVATGPLTNVALALRKDPDFVRNVAEVIVMGGTVGTPGNKTPLGEANFGDDPEAAAVVLEAPCKVTVVGLNVTHQTRMDDEMREGFRRAGTAAGELAHRVAGFYLDVYEKLGRRRQAALHDPLAVAAAADPTLIETTETWATVELTGQHTRGMLVYDLRSFAPRPAKPVHVATGVDVERFLQLARERIPGMSR